MVTSHVLTWEVTESQGYETSWIEFRGMTLQAHGRAVGTRPEVYWLSYDLDTGEDFVTRELHVRAATAMGSRELRLLHDGDAGGPPTGSMCRRSTAHSTAIWDGVRSPTPCRSSGTVSNWRRASGRS